MMSTTTIISEKELFIKMVMSNWDLQVGRMNKVLAQLSDEELLSRTAPGRNSGVYLLGHLAAVSDGMFTFLGLGEKLNPNMDEIFVRNPEESGLERPSIAELKEYWSKVNSLLSEKMSQITPEEWFNRHTAISEEDFAREPHRNKLNIVINRTNHISYHLGQLVYLVKK
jgi:hypothetical protein